jgi:hypothetical protein
MGVVSVVQRVVMVTWWLSCRVCKSRVSWVTRQCGGCGDVMVVAAVCVV